MSVWYAHLDVEQGDSVTKSWLKASRVKATQALLAKARTRDSTQALEKLPTIVDEQRRIISDPPLVVPVEELFPNVEATALND